MSADGTSWYSASVPTREPRPALEGTVETEVAVIGGGIAGCSTALHLAERGHRVCLLEAEEIGWGASGRSGGQLLPGIACGQTALEELVGIDIAKQICSLTVEALGLQRDLMRRHAIDCDYRSGHLQVAISKRHETALRHEFTMLQERYAQHQLQWLDREPLRQQLASERYRSAIFDPNAGHVHPLKYVRGLAAAAERCGVQIHEHSRVLRYASRRDRLEVHTSSGQLRADRLVFCGNATLGTLAPSLARKILTVTTYLVATASLGAERAAALIRNDAAVADTQWVLDYFRRSADHRLLFGGRVSYSGFDARGIRQATRARLLRVFPQLADVPLEFAWGGELDITRNRAPHFGQLEPAIYFLQGFSGHGMALAGLAGALVAEAIDGDPRRFNAFARIPHRDFPGGPLLRRPALALAMLWYRLRDLT